MQIHCWNEKPLKLSWNVSPALIASELSLDTINSRKNPLLRLWLRYLTTKSNITFSVYSWRAIHRLYLLEKIIWYIFHAITQYNDSVMWPPKLMILEFTGEQKIYNWLFKLIIYDIPTFAITLYVSVEQYIMEMNRCEKGNAFPGNANRLYLCYRTEFYIKSVICNLLLYFMKLKLIYSGTMNSVAN